MATTRNALQPLHASVLGLIEQLKALVAWRYARERQVEDQTRAALEGLDQRQRQQTQENLRRARDQEAQLRQHDADQHARLADLRQRYRSQFKQLKQALKARYREFHRTVDQARKSYADAAWESNTIHEATRTGVRTDLETYGSQLEALRARVRAVREQALLTASEWSISQIDIGQHRQPPAESAAKLRADLAAAGDRAAELVERARNWPRVGTSGWIALSVGLVLGLVSTVIIGMTFRWLAAVLVSPLALVLFAGVGYLVHWLVQRVRIRRVLAEAMSLAGWVEENIVACRRMMELEGQERIRRDAERHRNELKRLRARLREELHAAHDCYRKEGQRLRDSLLLELRRTQNEVLALEQELDGSLERQLAELRTWRHRALLDAKQKYQEEKEQLTQASRHWHEEVVREFTSRLDELRQEVDQLWQQCRARFPDWHTFDPERWQPEQEPAEWLYIGRLSYDLIEHARAAEGWFEHRADAVVELPALIPLAPPGALFVTVAPEHHRTAVVWQRTFAARFLQAVPPGQFRLLLLDPAFLGDPFAGLMHLADYDRRVVSGRIWSEPRAIDEQLARLQEQLETVIQAFLRDRFATLREYNRSAGEVAEPYRLVVLTDYPDSLPESAQHRLHAIATNAARCGVTLLLLHPDRTVTGTADEDLLSPVAVTGKLAPPLLVWGDDGSEALPPVELEAEPPPDVFSRLVHRVGALAAEAGRVEVPMERIVPEPSQWWQASAAEGLAVPLGVVGAHAVQELQLGQGTAQHVLVAGRTGSGKSNLLHVLITSAALKYSPGELLLYLIDFKKGVEFKAYATHDLPHACVVAIESEREFGLSVLQQLDREMQRRGELFRAAGVQDLPSYRRARPEEPLPRILLIVDEFQEFFVEDDQIAQQAALLLDRLVRQGRAFGMHALLGSQTLSGAYALARSTVSQMGVRIALQCSEGDAHLILSEDNPAARLLSRPGEAIYNDANGLVEGNRRFQIAWLPGPKRDVYLEKVRELSRRHGLTRPSPMLVFEGNVPADLDRNDLLAKLLDRPWDTSEAASGIRLWIGESVALPRPVACPLEPRAGANLLVVGQDPGGAAGVLAASIISAAAQRPPGNDANALRVYVVDESTPERMQHVLWQQLAQSLPHEINLVPRGTADELITRLAAQLDAESKPDTFTLLVLYDAARLRSLRANEDLFGFGEEDERSRVDRAFRRICEDGPESGIHVLVWCDTATNVQRVLGRTGTREFGLRVVFQMSANDSTSLIDSPAAAKLGVHRALFYDEDRGELEKFRPYAVPGIEQIERLARRIRNRFAAP